MKNPEKQTRRLFRRIHLPLLFWVCSLLFVLHQVLQHVAVIYIPLANAYLDNLLAMPILLSLLKAERVLLWKKGPSYRLPLLETGIATVYISLVSELVFPKLSSRFTYDPVDFIFYVVGAAVYAAFEWQSIRVNKTIASLEE